MANTKKRRSTEIYENYWKFTAAHLNIMDTKFNNCLNIIVLYIDKYASELEEHAKSKAKFSASDLYKNLQDQIVIVSEFGGKNPTISARKVINQFVKIGFVNPFLLGYHPLVRSFMRESNEEKKRIIFSKIFYERSSLASNVTVDNRNIKHIAFLLKTLDKIGSLTKDDIMALMVTNITQCKSGYLTREQLDSQHQFAEMSEFNERKYNQIAHLIAYLKWFVDLKYDKRNETFYLTNDPQIAEKDLDQVFARDGVKHRIYKDELREESKSLFGQPVCYLYQLPYKTLIASHIKPCVDCLKEQREDQAYDVNNGLLLSPTIDSYFDKKDITFTDEGNIIIGKAVDKEIGIEFSKHSLDPRLLNDERKQYLSYHRSLFEQKNGRN